MSGNKTTSVKIQLKHLELLDELVRKEFFYTRAEAIRYTLKEYLMSYSDLIKKKEPITQDSTFKALIKSS